MKNAGLKGIGVDLNTQARLVVNMAGRRNTTKRPETSVLFRAWMGFL
ncbi:MAG: hypothetical protein WC346_21430 [Methanogenium sp.]